MLYICNRDDSLFTEQIEIIFMIQTEQLILEKIMRLLDDLDKATYGCYRANGNVIPSDASRFYYSAKRLYEQVDILVKDYSPDYVSPSDYRFICNSQRVTLLNLKVLKDSKKLKGQELTWELEKYLMEFYGMFSRISTHCEKCRYKN